MLVVLGLRAIILDTEEDQRILFEIRHDSCYVDDAKDRGLSWRYKVSGIGGYFETVMQATRCPHV
jgi:hypothetical protein